MKWQERRTNVEPSSHIILTPMTSRFYPCVVLAFPLLSIHPDPQSPLHPLLAAHLGETREGPSKRKALLVAAEDGGGLEGLHGEAKVVHHHTHRVGEIAAFASLERALHFRLGEEEVGQRHFRGQD